MSKEKFKSWLDQTVNKITSKANSENKAGIYQVFDDLEIDKEDEKENDGNLSLKEELSNIKQPEKKNGEFFSYIASNFTNPLYKFKYKDYFNNTEFFGAVRGSSTIEAKENAKKIYNLRSLPEKTWEIQVKDDRLIDKVRANPTFFLTKKVKKEDLGIFLIEYSSLREDDLDKGQAIDILKDMITDKALLDFMEVYKSSSTKMSSLMSSTGMFDDYTISIIESSEQSGGNSKFFTGIRDLGESYLSEEEFRKGLIKKMIYPGVLVMFVVGLLVLAIKGLVPVLAGLFMEIVGEDGLPDIMLTLMSLEETFIPTMIKWGIILAVILTIKKILLTNSTLLGFYESFKLKLPLFGIISKTIEENRLFRILAQTLTSNLSELNKLETCEKATTSILYKGVYRQMRLEYPKTRNLLITIEKVNEKFGGVFTKKALIILNLAKGDSKKILSKYESFLKKNTAFLYEKLGIVTSTLTTISIFLVAGGIGGVFALIFSMVLSLTG